MKNFVYKIFNYIRNYISGGRDTCRLLEIDLSKQEVKFQVKMKLPVLKCSIGEAINELNLVTHISAIEACYLGGHYGRMISARWVDSSISRKENKKITLLMTNNEGRYQILYKDRSGNIGYYDKKLQKEFIESPLMIVNNEKLVSSFNSSQACFIGISAGLLLGKKTLKSNTTDEPNCLVKKRPHLKLVK